MRLVRWSPQERVDVPDITAMSFLMLGEFRRHVRGLLLGPSASPATIRHSSYIVKGFAVEPQAVPDSTVRVRLDPSIDVLSFAIGAENLGPFDFGQLIGGDDAAGNTEGNASTTVDFSLLPANTYYVELRFVYTEGANDNRAFWDAGTNSEFIAATDTRHLPTYELRAVTAISNSDEWITLASVVWDTIGPITTAEITDARSMPFEGVAGFFQTADSDQDSFDGGGDFNRGTDRGSVVASINEVYPALRALARQVRDIKGPAFQGAPISGQRWNWFSRPFAPQDFGGGGLPFSTQHTKNLASVDVVTYTIGDGVDTWGDFNGVSGLEDCFAAIDGNATANGRPRRVKIVMKAGNRSGTTFLVSTLRDFTADGDIHIEIEGVSANEATGDKGQVEIAFTAAGSDFMWLQARGFTLKNLKLLVTTERQGLIACEEIDAYNTVFQCTADFTTFAQIEGGNYALDVARASGDGEVRVFACQFSGGPVRVLDSASDFTIPFNRARAAGFWSTTFGADAPLLLNDIADAVTGTNTTRCSAGLLVEGCNFNQPSVLQTAYVGCVDARISENVTFRDCQFNGTSRQADIIHCGSGAGAGTRPNPANLVVDNCLFNLGFVRASAVNGALNGADGTGWGIYVNTTGLNPSEDASSVTVRNCTFEGATGASIDSGAVFLRGLDRASVLDNHFFGFAAPSGSRVRIIETAATGGAGQGRLITVAGNQFSKFEISGATGEVVCVYALSTEGIRVHGNLFRGKTDSGASFVGSPTLSAAIVMQSNQYFGIHENHFEGFNAQDACVRVEPVAGTGCSNFAINDNTFDEVCAAVAGSFAIDCSLNAVMQGNISDNVITTGALGAGIDVSGTNDMVVNDNNVQAAASADAVGIQWAGTSATSMCSGNRVNGQTINATGAGVIYGVLNAARIDLNYYP